MSWDSLFHLAQAALLLGLLAAWLTAFLQTPLTGRLTGWRGRSFSSRFWMGWGLLPASVAGLIATFVLFFATLSGTGWLTDHCLSHAGHPHICLRHISDLPPGGGVAWALLILGAGRILWVARTPLLQLIALRKLRQGHSRRHSASGPSVRLLPGDRPLAFTVGTLFPEICWTEGVVRLLQEDEREIVLIHEETHRRHRDPLKALVLYILQKSLTGGEAILSHWRQRREEECDLACVERGHHPTQVAATVLKMQRAASLSPATPISLHYARSCDPHELRRRIENLLEPPGDSLGPGLPVLLLSLLGAAVILEAPFTHHFLETVLGWLTF